MAKHRTDPQTRGLLDALPETRADLLLVIDELSGLGVTRGEIAKAARWNPGYLSEVLKGDGKRPTAAKVADLVGALRVLGDTAGIAVTVAGALRRVAERYGVPWQALANPAAGPVGVAAPNWVRRPIEEEMLRVAVATPGTYAIDGHPMTGVSSTLLLVETLLARRGIETCRLSARVDLYASKRIERSKTDVLGALAAVLARDDTLLDGDFYAAQNAIRDRLVAAPAGFALLLDDMNDLSLPDQETLKALLRDWATKRAAGIAEFVNATTWVAFTSDVREVKSRSHLQASYTIIDWFDRRQVQQLAEALAPFSVASGRVTSAQAWASEAATKTLELFGGQPQLTHFFLWDRHLDGETSAPALLKMPPAGAYEHHLRRLAHLLKGLLGAERASQVLDELAETGTIAEVATPSEWQTIERLGIVKPDGRWRSRYYATHLPKTTASVTPKPR